MIESIQAGWVMDRARALTIHCRYCTTPEGQKCYNRRTGVPLHKQPAHLLQDCGLT